MVGLEAQALLDGIVTGSRIDVHVDAAPFCRQRHLTGFRGYLHSGIYISLRSGVQGGFGGCALSSIAVRRT